MNASSRLGFYLIGAGRISKVAEPGVEKPLQVRPVELFLAHPYGDSPAVIRVEQISDSIRQFTTGNEQQQKRCQGSNGPGAGPHQLARAASFPIEPFPQTV